MTRSHQYFRQPCINKYNYLKHTHYCHEWGKSHKCCFLSPPPVSGHGPGVTAGESYRVATWIRFSYSHEVSLRKCVTLCRGWQQIFRIQWGAHMRPRLYTITSNVTQWPAPALRYERRAMTVDGKTDVRCGQAPWTDLKKKNIDNVKCL